MKRALSSAFAILATLAAAVVLLALWDTITTEDRAAECNRIFAGRPDRVAICKSNIKKGNPQ